MDSAPNFRGKCRCDSGARGGVKRDPPSHHCCRTTPSKEAAQGEERSERATKRLCIASDCLLINLGVKSLKNNHDLHSPSICVRLFNCCCSVEKDHSVHGLSGSPASQAQREKG